MDKGLKDRQKFREDFLKLMKDHDITSATVQFMLEGDSCGEYDDFIINDNESRVDELEALIKTQGYAVSYMGEVLACIKSDNRYRK
jgi:hypothetical protein